MSSSPVRQAGKRPDNSRSMLYVMLKKYGIIGSCQLVWNDVLPDLWLGTDTARLAPQQCGADGLPIDGRNRYVPATYSAIASCFAYVAQHVDFSQCNFVDYGSGKGKALIAASQESFVNVVGIEVNPLLHTVACRNLDRLKCGEHVQSKLGDASTYSPGKQDRVLYFFNPFTGDALERCLENIAAISDGITRYIIYINPTEDEVFRRYFVKLDEINFEPGAVEVNFYRFGKSV